MSLGARLMLHFFPPPLQQNAPAKEGAEQGEVAILKTCQSISELRREVSTRLAPLLSKCPHLSAYPALLSFFHVALPHLPSSLISIPLGRHSSLSLSV